MKNLSKLSVLLQIEQVKTKRLSGVGFLTFTHTHTHTHIHTHSSKFICYMCHFPHPLRCIVSK